MRALGGLPMKRAFAVLLAFVGVVSLVAAVVLGAALWVWLTTMPWVA